MFYFRLVADDENLVLKHEYISILESVNNSEFDDVHTWLSGNKLSLNIEKSNCVIIHPVKNRVKKVTLFISNQLLIQESSVRYHHVLEPLLSLLLGNLNRPPTTGCSSTN